jgi:hypothetical protein
VTNPNSIILSLNKETNFTSFKFDSKLFNAKIFFFSEDSKMPPMPYSLQYINEIIAVRMVLILQEELQVSL